VAAEQVGQPGGVDLSAGDVGQGGWDQG